ncbi:MAG: hypothetical protein HYU36_07990 [Planctomycetes bacterium]|nr:hypothetical protein [Planctomycetota bacterium]
MLWRGVIPIPFVTLIVMVLICFLILIAFYGSALLFGREQVVLDRRKGTFSTGLAMGVWVWRTRGKLSGYSKVLLDRREEPAGKGRTNTVYCISLSGESEPVLLGRAGTWESAVPIAEAAAHFLRFPIHDATQGVTRGYHELDLSLRERVASAAPAPASPPDRPADCRSEVEESPDGHLRIRVPRPATMTLARVSVVGFLFWTIPVGFLGNPLVGILPPLCTFLGWLKVRYGLSADVDLSPERLRACFKGLVFRKTVDFPIQELEEVALVRRDTNGHLDMAYEEFAGFLVARSDRASIRFGHGLSWKELEWLQRLIHQRLAEISQPDASGAQCSPRAASESSGISTDGVARIPRWHRPVFPLVGLFAGAILGNVTGGPLSISANAPFLEHILNVGTVTGLLLGLCLHPSQNPGKKPTSLHASMAWSALLLIGLYFLMDLASPAVQMGTRFDELSFLKSGDESIVLTLSVLTAGAIAHAAILSVVSGICWWVYDIFKPERSVK